MSKYQLFCLFFIIDYDLFFLKTWNLCKKLLKLRSLLYYKIWHLGDDFCPVQNEDQRINVQQHVKISPFHCFNVIFQKLNFLMEYDIFVCIPLTFHMSPLQSNLLQHILLKYNIKKDVFTVNVCLRENN